MPGELKEPPVIIMLGSPGSGKGTQAEKLREECGYEHVSPGELLRDLQSRNDLTNEQVQELQKMKEGKMVGHWLVYDVMFPRIKKALDEGRGLVIDGAIRTLEQVDGYLTFLDDELGVKDHIVVFWIQLDENIAKERMEQRRKMTEGTSKQRQDDADTAVMEMRFKVQGAQAQKSVLEKLAEYVPVEYIQGDQSIEDVASDIKKVLKDYGIT